MFEINKNLSSPINYYGLPQNRQIPNNYISSNTKMPAASTDSLSFGSNSNISKKDKSNDGKFSILEAGKNFIKGAGSFITETIKHPVKSLLIVCGLGVASILCPPLGSVLIASGALTGAFALGGGIIKAGKCAANKDGDGAEKAFTNIGSGISTLLLTAVFARDVSAAKGAQFSKFSFKNSNTWLKESFNAIKQEGFRNGDLKSALRFTEANIQAGYKTIKSWHANKNSGFDFTKNFIETRRNIFNNIYDKKIFINGQGKEVPSGIINKIKVFFSSNKDKTISNIENAIKIRHFHDMQDLQLSDQLIPCIKSPKELFRQSWTFSQNKNN